jgi:diguanylate cyclase (GGDEF)-like protein
LGALLEGFSLKLALIIIYLIAMEGTDYRQQVVVLLKTSRRLKQINDTFAHEEGSLAILRLADILKGTFREGDIVARLGGDEFAVLVMDVTGRDKESISNRLQENLRNYNNRSPSGYALSLSVGIVSVDLDTTTATVDQLIAQADQ